MLPRLTLRTVQNQEGKHGFGNSDIFVLGILKDWGTGRWGIGPQINFPGQEGFGSTKWGAGLAAAVTQRALSDKLFFALLLQQTWTGGKASNLGINPVIVAQLGKGWYVGNGDFVISYNWENGGLFVPFGIRLGKAFINEKRTINTYLEYRTWSAAPNWEGSIADNSFRINIQWQIPVSFN